MSEPALVVFDDEQGAFGPLTDLRAVFELRSGAVFTWQRIMTTLRRPLAAVRVPAALVPLVRQRLTVPVNEPLPPGALLLINGRWLGGGDEHVAAIQALVPGQALVEHAEASDAGSEHSHPVVAAAWLSAPAAELFFESGQLAADITRHEAPPNMLAHRPWDVLRSFPAALAADLATSPLSLLSHVEQGTVTGDFPVRAAPDVVIEPGARLLAYEGPIVLEAGARVAANAVIYGPTWIGPHVQVNAQATLGPHVAVGPHCKIGGEVKSASIHSHSNKGHAGFLGHALVGQWVNLGADTTVSNLKNTYGPVRVQLAPDGPAQDTGLTFHGPIIGDHVLTAIGTRLLTGTCVGTGAMLALSSMASQHVAGMQFHTDAGSVPYDFTAFVTSARRRMARRDVQPTDAEVARWRALADGHR